jgi:limonene-1,2-epoxide hydrolase
MPTAIEVVTRMYECFNKADLDTIKKEIFHPNLVWNLPGRHPLAGQKRGADEVLAFFHQLNKAGVIVDLVKIAAWGDDTAVEVHRGHADLPNGLKLDGVNCTHYHVDNDGLIDKVQVYVSDQYALDQFFNAVYQYAPIPQRLADPS